MTISTDEFIRRRFRPQDPSDGLANNFGRYSTYELARRSARQQRAALFLTWWDFLQSIRSPRVRQTRLQLPD